MQTRGGRGRSTSHGFAYINNDLQNTEGKMDMRKGPWTSEEDKKLIDFITLHGEGRWNSLTCLAGLNRTGKSCRLRWLNYLHPNLRRGNLTIQEQLLIIELHSRFGNRWSRIAQYLPGRTDNEIKNYWRTIVQKQARRLNCDANSHYFRYTLRSLWLPRLIMEQSWAASPELFDHFQPNNNCANHNTYWIDQDMAVSQTALPPTFTGYDSQKLQGSSSLYTSDPSAWNDSRGNHGSDKCSLEKFSLCPSEGLCSPFDDGTASFLELDDQAFVDMTEVTEPVSPDIHLTDENFWLLPVEQTLESLISS